MHANAMISLPKFHDLNLFSIHYRLFCVLQQKHKNYFTRRRIEILHLFFENMGLFKSSLFLFRRK